MNNNLPSEAVAHAVAVLKNEHVIAYPTEAVFGVGCDPDSETAVMRLLERAFQYHRQWSRYYATFLSDFLQW